VKKRHFKKGEEDAVLEKIRRQLERKSRASANA
jgi:hypothetical protein